jgi:RND family efflux transporter MFP subunit
MRDDDSINEPRSDAEEKDLERRRRRTARLIGIGALVALLLVIAFGGWGAYRRHEETLTTLSRINEVRTVRTMVAKAVDTPNKVHLPGTMEPNDVATIYARATGYVAKRVADFGSKVHQGDLLAVIAAPDLDQQLSQSRAQLVQTEAAIRQAQATATLQAATNNRTQTLVKEGWQTKQQGDIDRLNLAADQDAVRSAQATAEAQRADVSRLEKLTAFEQVRAPFDGVVTDRQVDVGSLVTADSSSGTALFALQRNNTLRVQVYVPQDDLFGLEDGMSADVTVPEIPGRTFKGTVSRMAAALQEGSRTMLVQVDVANDDNALRAGLYCTVDFTIPAGRASITVPSQAIIFNKNGLSVAVVEDGKARLRPIDVKEDNGGQLSVESGLKEGDQVILSPPINLVDGMPVKIAEDPPKHES